MKVLNTQTQQEELFYPATTVGSVVDESTRKPLQDVLSDITASANIPTEVQAASVTADGWKLTGVNGLCSSDSNYRLAKYSVVAGDVLKLTLSKDGDAVAQFQSAASVPSSGTNGNLVGQTYVVAIKNGIVKVPTNATYLIVSQLKTNSSNMVEKVTEGVDINSVIGLNDFDFDFTTGSTAAWANRNVAYNFVSGHTYNIKVKTTDTSVRTYFSTRNASDPSQSIQNSLCNGTGARNEDFVCTANADSFFMTIAAEMTTGIVYEVEVVDKSVNSLATLKVQVDNVVDGTEHLINNSTFTGKGSGTAVNVIPEGIVSGRTYALTFNGSDVLSLVVYATKTGSSDYILWSKGSSQTFELPILFYIPDGYDGVKLAFQAIAGKKVLFSFEDVTEALLSLSEQKIPLFELGQQYTAVFPQEAYSSTSRARIKPGYRMHLKEGDIIHLKNSGYRFFLNYVRMNDPSTNYGSAWQTSDYTISEEGLYCMAITPYPETGSYTDSKTLASQIEIVPASDSSSSVNVDDIIKSLQYDVHDEERTFTFNNTGHYIKTDGTLGDSQYWNMGNVVRLYKGETVEIFCSTTYYGVIIALTDLEQSFYTPVVTVLDNQVKALHKYTATEDCYIILQYFQITGSPSIYTDSQRVISIENRLVGVESDIEEIKASKPQYVIDETERIKRKLLSIINGNATIFTFNTDQHFEYPFLSGSDAYNPKYVMHGVNAIVDIAKEIPLDMIVMGGDVAGYDGSTSSTIKGILQEVEHLNSPFMDLNVLEVSIPGNHDAFQNNGNITAQGMYNVHFKRSKFTNFLHHEGTDNCDCYYDDTDKKIRYIFVDTYSQNVRTESYTTFLTNALSTLGNDYKAVIFSHNPLTNEFAGVVRKINSQGQDSDAFENPTDLHTIINQYASKVIACICGHTHADAYGISSAGILYITTTTAAAHTIGHTTDGIPYTKTVNSATETAFDFFVIDTVNQTLEAVRYGQGTNRKWKYKGTGQGLISNKNCVGVKCSVPSLSLVFTNASNSSDSVTVVCDGTGFGEAYLTLGATYNITCSGHTLSVNSVSVDENKSLNITVS